MSLWKHADFLKLWIGQTISLFGSQITFLALALVAVEQLNASPAQMGLLAALATLPNLLIAPVVGVWVDRLHRRPLLIGADIGRALLLATIPVAALLGQLRIEQLYLVTLLSGTFSLLFNVAEEALLPSLLRREQLVEGNSRLALSTALSDIAGPALAGSLVQLLTAPVAIVVDAFSFLLSALFLGAIRTPESAPPPADEHPPVWKAAREGLHLVLRHPLLRPMVAESATREFCGGMYDALLILYLTRELQLPPAAIGLVYAVGSLSGLTATLLAPRATQRVGPGPAMVVSSLLIGLGWLFVPLASGGPLLAFVMIAFGAVLFGVGNTTNNIVASSLSQSVTPDDMLGRVNASQTFLVGGMLPIGSLVAGGLATLFGLRPVLLVAGLGLSSAFLWLFFSPIRGLKVLPAVIEEDVVKRKT
ncbi:MAG: MFS transporter [Ardenticatenales bacterium]|nr:MFS transporter [Ardenticatenales bacterium]